MCCCFFIVSLRSSNLHFTFSFCLFFSPGSLLKRSALVVVSLFDFFFDSHSRFVHTHKHTHKRAQWLRHAFVGVRWFFFIVFVTNGYLIMLFILFSLLTAIFVCVCVDVGLSICLSLLLNKTVCNIFLRFIHTDWNITKSAQSNWLICVRFLDRLSLFNSLFVSFSWPDPKSFYEAFHIIHSSLWLLWFVSILFLMFHVISILLFFIAHHRMELNSCRYLL